MRKSNLELRPIRRQTDNDRHEGGE